MVATLSNTQVRIATIGKQGSKEEDDLTGKLKTMEERG